MVTTALSWTIGAWFGGNLGYTKRNLRMVAFWGCILMLPFTWSYWAFIHRPTEVNPATGVNPYAIDSTDTAAMAAPPTWKWINTADLMDYYW